MFRRETGSVFSFAGAIRRQADGGWGAHPTLAAHPTIPARLVVHSGTRATNPKISNLAGVFSKTSHDLVLISDSNIRAPTNYLRDLVEQLSQPNVGLVTSVIAGTDDRSFGGALDCAQLNGFDACAVVTATASGAPIVIGKSMFFRRSVFERLGGLDAVAHVLAEDYVIGKMFQHGGYDVCIGRVVVQNVVGAPTVKTHFLRHLRWSLLRVRLHVPGFVMEPFAGVLVPFFAAWFLFGAPWAILWAVGLLVVRDVGGWVCLRGWRRAYVPLLVAVPREIMSLSIWLVTPFVKRVAWRGHSVRVGVGSMAFVQDPVGSPRSSA